jgi:hypothetical protein
LGKNPLQYQIPAHETEEGKKRLDAYYLALGRFAHRFSLVELAVHIVLSHYASLPMTASRALLSGVRIDETRSRLSRLHEVQLISDADWADIEPIFAQLALINKCRNEIFHHGGSFIAEGRGIVTNATTALTEERITGFEISPDILDDMTGDLRKILIRLHVRHMGRPPLRGKHPEMEDGLRGPWRYTQQPKPLKEPRKPSHPADTKPPAHSSPQKSSSD